MVRVQGYVQDYDVVHLRWWLIHVGMSLWYVVRLTTYLDLASPALRFEDLVNNYKSNLTSGIG
jgi:hypothetical protein